MGLSNLPPGVTDRMIEEQAGGDPHPVSEEIYGILEDAGVAQNVIDMVCEKVDNLIANYEGQLDAAYDWPQRPEED